MESMTAVSNVAKSRAPYGTCTTRINAGWVHYIQLCDRMRSEKNAALSKGVDYTYWRHWRSYKIRWTSRSGTGRETTLHSRRSMTCNVLSNQL